MPLDPMLFKRVSAAAEVRAATVANRTANSDHTEAKANIIVDRILSSANANIQDAVKPGDSVEESKADIKSGFVLPPAEASGLVSANLTLDESQVAAINMLIQKQYGCLIGAAGSGKTTCQRFFLQKMIYGDDEFGVEPMTLRNLGGKQGLNIALCAFTGIATQVIKQNMPEWLYPACKTIHSLLEYGPVTTEITTKDGETKETQIFMPMRHVGNKLDHEIIIIDEASMVGLDLWHQLLDACRPGTKIFLIGDLNQLPPVMSQSMFAYALSEWPVAELTHIHRQKEASANKIIDVAHSILTGKEFEFDDARTNHDWRVIGFELDAKPQKAGMEIVAICNSLVGKRVNASVDPETPLVYDPYRDRIITAGNGYDESDPRACVQQFVINDALSRLIQPPSKEHPIFIIDAGLSKKKFAVGHRVMATRNEPPDVADRVTNGMVGRITDITKHPGWSGNHALVGPEDEVAVARKKQVEQFFRTQNMSEAERVNEALGDDFDSRLDMDLDLSDMNKEKDREGGGPASHKVTVEFANGATRVFASKTNMDSLQLAYASTCHKCQGSQMDTAIIIVHHVWKSQLCREWFYTAVTRAVKRVIILHTKHGIKNALAKQKIFGSTLSQKIQKYKELQEEGVGILKTKARLYINDELPLER